MKKFLVCVLLLCMVTGCHGSKGLEEFTVPESFDTAQEYEITFWAKNDTNKNQVQIYQDAIASFEKAYPNIHVTMKLYTDYGMIYNDVITNIATNTTPNVCITYPDHIATYLSGQNVVVPLDELMDDEKYGLGGSEIQYDGVKKEEVISRFLNEGIVEGTQYAIPYMRSSEMCYINKTYVEKLGYKVPDVLTWDFIFEVSEKAMEQNADGTYKVNNQNVLIPFIYKSTDNMMIQMLRQKNAGYSNENGEILLFNDATKEILEEIAKHAETRAFSTFKISSYPANFLNAGQCIFAIDSTAGSTWMGTDAPLVDIAEDKIVQFETAVRLIPQFDPEHPQMISQGPSVCLFNKKDSQEVLASWLFAQYLLSNDVQIAYSQTEGYVPVTTKALQDETYQQYLNSTENDAVHYKVKLDAVKLVLENIENTFVTPVFNGSASLRDASGQLIEEVVKSKRRNQTVNDAYYQSLFDKVESLYRLDQGPTTIGGKKDLGPLPTGAKALIGGLVTIWIILGAVYISGEVKRKKNVS